MQPANKNQYHPQQGLFKQAGIVAKIVLHVVFSHHFRIKRRLYATVLTTQAAPKATRETATGGVNHSSLGRRSRKLHRVKPASYELET